MPRDFSRGGEEWYSYVLLLENVNEVWMSIGIVEMALVAKHVWNLSECKYNFSDFLKQFLVSCMSIYVCARIRTILKKSIIQRINKQKM